MTFRRLIGRNRLHDGGYEQVPESWWTGKAGEHVPGLSTDQLESIIASHNRWFNEASEGWNRRVKALVGDLRRLEKDTVDEGAICAGIAAKTGIDAEVVAAVLKEWLAT